MSNNKHKQFFQGKECFSRMNFLYQASMLMAGRNDTLSGYYGSLCRSIGKKSVLRIDPDVKRSLCKRCNVAQKPGITADLSTTKCPKRRKESEHEVNIDKDLSMQMTCRKCGKKRNFAVNSNYGFWLEKPESVAEIMTVKAEAKTQTVPVVGLEKGRKRKCEKHKEVIEEGDAIATMKMENKKISEY